MGVGDAGVLGRDASGAVCGCPSRVRTSRKLHRGRTRRPAYRRMLFAAFAAARIAIFPVLSSVLSRQGQQQQPPPHRGSRRYFVFLHPLAPGQLAVAHAVLLGLLCPICCILLVSRQHQLRSNIRRRNSSSPLLMSSETTPTAPLIPIELRELVESKRLTRRTSSLVTE